LRVLVLKTVQVTRSHVRRLLIFLLLPAIILVLVVVADSSLLQHHPSCTICTRLSYSLGGHQLLGTSKPVGREKREEEAGVTSPRLQAVAGASGLNFLLSFLGGSPPPQLPINEGVTFTTYAVAKESKDALSIAFHLSLITAYHSIATS